jgi:hypothetical protein
MTVDVAENQRSPLQPKEPTPTKGASVPNFLNENKLALVSIAGAAETQFIGVADPAAYHRRSRRLSSPSFRRITHGTRPLARPPLLLSIGLGVELRSTCPDAIPFLGKEALSWLDCSPVSKGVVSSL